MDIVSSTGSAIVERRRRCRILLHVSPIICGPRYLDFARRAAFPPEVSCRRCRCRRPGRSRMARMRRTIRLPAARHVGAKGVRRRGTGVIHGFADIDDLRGSGRGSGRQAVRTS